MTPERIAELRECLKRWPCETKREYPERECKCVFCAIEGLLGVIDTQALAVALLHEEAEEMNRLFELRHRADMRATERWRAEKPDERELRMPDQADLCVWLLERIEEFERDDY